MDEKKLLEELIPPEERKKKWSTDRLILEAVAKKGISYPSEIVAITGYSRQTVLDHIRMLVYRGKLEKVMIHNRIPDELQKRLPELWEQGLKGGTLRRMSWYKVKKEE